MATVTVVAGPAPDAAAATISIGTIQAQMADQQGQNNGTSGNCITYAPPNTSTSSALVTSSSVPNEAQTGHGYKNSCPNTLSTSTQSVVGFQPAGTNSVTDGQTFLIGRMIHYNNPISANDRYFTGKLNTVLGGFTTPNTVTFDWRLDETPNSGGSNCCDDEITFTNQISNVTLNQGGQTYRLVILGFTPVANATTCPLNPVGNVKNDFFTVEGQQTHACLYASLVQVRNLVVVKTVVGTPPSTPTFNYTSTATLAGSAWANGNFPLTPGAGVTREILGSDTVKITETDPADDRWALTNLACTQIGANGQPEAVPGVTVNQAARQVTLTNVPAPPLSSQPNITCTYTNTYTPKSTLTLVKQVSGGTATASQWTLTATGSAAAPPSGFTISGPSGSSAVNSQRVPAGTYTLSELGTGSAATGYVQNGAWVCVTGGGTAVPVTSSTVTLPNSASGGAAAVTCTVANRFATGSLRIAKVVDAPTGAYTGGTTKTFSGTYDCGTGYTGSYSTLTTAAAVTINNIPTGRTCTVAETAPTGGLANASYAWGPATFSSQPVTIPDGGSPAVVTITNPVVQKLGSFAMTKTVNGPGGYIAGTGRVFPVNYSCVLTGGPTTSGSLDLTTAQAASVTQIPTGSVCSFTETLNAQPGDFSDPSYTWSGYTLNPQTVTIGDNTTAAIELTNNYTRQFGSLTVTKTVQGDGYLGGADPHFLVGYDCGSGFAGTRTLTDGGSATITGLPAGATCGVSEIDGGADPALWPSPTLLGPAYTWGTPTWSPSNVVQVVANANVTAAVTNPTVPIFGKVSVTKSVTGETQGLAAGTTFALTATCDNQAAPYAFQLAPGATGTTPDLPVGTKCVISETPPSSGLIDSSFAWGPAPADQTVTVTASGQEVAVGVTNTVVRVSGQLTITKAAIVPSGVVDADREFDVQYSCLHAPDDPVAGQVSLTAGQTSTAVTVFLGSICTVTEVPATLSAPPDAEDASWVWLAPTYAPNSVVTVTSSDTPQAVTVTNLITQLTGSFNVSKAVIGAGKVGGYTPGDAFGFSVVCSDGQNFAFDLADGGSFEGPAVPAFTECTATELTKPATTASYGWDEVRFYVNAQGPTAGPSVSFQIPESGAPVQVNAINPITPRVGSVQVVKAFTGETTGLLGAPSFPVTLNCGAGGSYQLSVPANGTATQDNIPIGSTCSATEGALDPALLVDASYAWGIPSYSGPVDVSATPTTVTVTNQILRVTQPLTVIKSFSGPQGVVDPARTYPIHWSCTYPDDTVVAEGDVNLPADPGGRVVSDSIPLTAVCTATEGDLGQPSVDPAYRWETPVITGTTVAAPGPNTVTVANTLTRDSGVVRVHKVVTGATEGYVNLTSDPPVEDFTLHGKCVVPGHPEIPARTADGSIANNGTKDIVASYGWSCSGYEDSPGQNLLKDSSYAWGTPILTPADSFTLSAENPVQAFTAENPIVRVKGTLTITKTVNDPNNVVADGVTFTGGYSCKYGDDDPITGPWSITGATGGSYQVPGDFYLGSVCTVIEDDPNTKSPNGLPDGSWTWNPPAAGEPATVVIGGTATVNITNQVARLWGGLAVSKTVVAPQGGVTPGAMFPGSWTCKLGSTIYGGRFSVGANATATAFTAADQIVPATASCTIVEDTLGSSGLADGSFAWGQPAYDPAQVNLTAGQTSTLGVTNTVVRVYSDVPVRKEITGPGTGLVDLNRLFDGYISCQYGTGTPVVIPWQASLDTPASISGVLVGSRCVVQDETPPGAGGRPVTDDPSFIWGVPTFGDSVTVTAPGTATPPLVVTNPTARLFGSFSVVKNVTGAIDGLVDPAATYPMHYDCVAGDGSTKSGDLDVPSNLPRTVGPEEQIPTGSVCTLTEPAETLPDLIDNAWAWDNPTFTVDGEPVEPSEPREVTFTIPDVQEDAPEPIVLVGVGNNITKTGGAYNVSKSSDPVSGTTVQPGSVVTYTLTVDSTGAVPVHDVVVSDDLSGVLPYGTVADGSITAPDGTTAALDTGTQKLTWTVGTVAGGTTLNLTYQVRINPGSAGVTISNRISSSADVEANPCTPVDPSRPDCSGTDNPTTAAPTITKRVIDAPVRDAGTGVWTVEYQIVVTNPNTSSAVPYSLSDVPGFPSGVSIQSAQLTAWPADVTPVDPPWDGVDNTGIAQDVTLPANGVHIYQISVQAVVPLSTPVADLACTAPDPLAGNGFFNQAILVSFGVQTAANACAPVPVVVAADKQWVIDGYSYPDGSQPVGFSATLTLDGQSRVWRTEYDGFVPGTAVDVGELLTIPADCTNSAVGTGAFEPLTAFGSLTVINTVICADNPVPPPIPPYPPYPPTPHPPTPYPPLPNTGFALEPYVGWAVGLIGLGMLLLFGGGIARRRNEEGAAAR